MPRVSAFYGIVITMYWRDHPPAHFHAAYAGHVAEIEIESLGVLDGWLPPRALRLVKKWRACTRKSFEATGAAPAPMTPCFRSTHCRSLVVMVAVTQVEPLEAYRLRLRFDDGSERVVDLADVLWGPMAEPLREPGYFRQVRVDPELRTIAWPNGFDLDPDVLHGDYEPDPAPDLAARRTPG